MKRGSGQRRHYLLFGVMAFFLSFMPAVVLVLWQLSVDLLHQREALLVAASGLRPEVVSGILAGGGIPELSVQHFHLLLCGGAVVLLSIFFAPALLGWAARRSFGPEAE